MLNNKIKLSLLLSTIWTIGLFITLIGGRLIISLASYFFIGDFDFDRNNLLRGAEIAAGCGVIIGVGQSLMSKEKSVPPPEP
ncbi:hypothetical protein V8O11_11725 [Erwinia aphidicola]|uniref:hypothetical protein n=1 Tax=Erwinia aphidicola TaxID=68334 RepID=UPI00300D74F6